VTRAPEFTSTGRDAFCAAMPGAAAAIDQMKRESAL
jgi:hypothetical protein